MTASRASTVEAEVSAYGGTGGSGLNRAYMGSAGDAEANVKLTASAPGSTATARATATGGDVGSGLSVNRVTGEIARAGNAVARAVVQADRSALAVAKGQQGAAPFTSNGANANVSLVLARAVSNGEAIAGAEFRMGGPNGFGTVTTRAEAIGGDGPAEAWASGNDSGMHEADASALASSRGAAGSTAQASSSGSVKAQSVSTGANGVRVEAMARTGSKSFHNMDYAHTQTNVGGTLKVGDGWEEKVTHSYATAAPTAASAAAALANAPQAAAALANDQIIGIGAIGISGSYFKTQMNEVATANYEFTTTGAGYLTLGLFGGTQKYSHDDDNQISFSISSHGEELFSRSFATATDAQLFFTDRVVNLGILAGGVQELLVTTTFDARTYNYFGFRYVFGVSPVPEPQTWLLMLLGSAVVAARMRRRQG
jgi:hypothetical protein